jgi:hypothetical protein
MEMLDHAEYICRAIARHSSAGNAATDSTTISVDHNII